MDGEFNYTESSVMRQGESQGKYPPFLVKVTI